MTTLPCTTTPVPDADLVPILDTVTELASLATSRTLGERGLPALAQRCRTTLGADVVLVAVRRAGRPEVVADADPDLDPDELRLQVVLAEASLDDPVIDGHPGLPLPEGEPGATVVPRRHLRRLVTELPLGDHVRGTLTVCRHRPFATDEVELGMAVAALASLLLAAAPAPSTPGTTPVGTDVVGRLFSVGIALQLVHRWTEDDALRRVVEDAIEQLDEALLDLRRSAAVARPQP